MSIRLAADLLRIFSLATLMNLWSYRIKFFLQLSLVLGTSFGAENDSRNLGLVDALENQYYFFSSDSGFWTVYRGGNPTTFCNGNEIFTSKANVIRIYRPMQNGTLDLRSRLPSPYKGSRRFACDTKGEQWIGMQVFDYERGDVRFHQFTLESGQWTDVRPLAIAGSELDVDYGSGQGFRLFSEARPNSFLYYSSGIPGYIIKSGDATPIFKSTNSFRPDTRTIDLTNASDGHGRLCVFELETSTVSQQFTWSVRMWDTNVLDWAIHGPRVTTESEVTKYDVAPSEGRSYINNSTGYVDSDIAVFFSQAASVVWSEGGRRFNKLHVATPAQTKLLGMFELDSKLFLVTSNVQKTRFWIAETKKEFLTKEEMIEPNWSESAYVDVVEMTNELTKNEQRSERFKLTLATNAIALLTVGLALFVIKKIYLNSRLQNSPKNGI